MKGVEAAVFAGLVVVAMVGLGLLFLVFLRSERPREPLARDRPGQ
jgi:hypothetical protein